MGHVGRVGQLMMMILLPEPTTRDLGEESPEESPRPKVAGILTGMQSSVEASS